MECSFFEREKKSFINFAECIRFLAAITNYHKLICLKQQIFLPESYIGQKSDTGLSLGSYQSGLRCISF